MKKLLISLAAGLVIDVLLQYAIKQRDEGGSSETHYQRWFTIIQFLVDMKTKGLPL